MRKIPKKLVDGTARLIRVKLFLNECGLSKYFNSVGELREVEKILKKEKFSP